MKNYGEHCEALYKFLHITPKTKVSILSAAKRISVYS